VDQLKDIPPGPANVPHALLDSEKEAIYTIACDEQYMDESHRTLAAKGSDEGLFHASASSVYRVLLERKMTTDRVDRARCNGKSAKPERSEIDGPNQRWCWDISYCHTEIKGVFLYLFALLDEYSRKVISWRISWNMTHKEGIESTTTTRGGGLINVPGRHAIDFVKSYSISRPSCSASLSFFS